MAEQAGWRGMIGRETRRLGVGAGALVFVAIVATRALSGGGSPRPAAAADTTALPARSAEANVKPLREWLEEPLLPAGRNLFIGAAAPAITTFESGAKSVPAPADAKGERTISQMRLQSTLMGAEPSAVINGQVVREGDVVATGTAPGPHGGSQSDFRVKKIEARRVIVEQKGVALEIPLD